MISAVSSISSSHYQKNEKFEECLRGSETKQCSSIILVCFTLSLTALIIWFLRMQSLPWWNFPFGWINTKEVGTENHPPQKYLSAQLVFVAVCVQLYGEWAIPIDFWLSGFPVCSVTQTLRSRQGRSRNLRASELNILLKTGPFSQLQSEEAHEITAGFTDRCVSPLNQEWFLPLHFILCCWCLCPPCLTPLQRQSRLLISGCQETVPCQRGIVLLSLESPTSTCLWCL